MTTASTACCFKVISLPTTVADRIRATGEDEFGHRAEEVMNDGARNVCRHCLQDATAGEPLLLVSYAPVLEGSPYRELGPIFIHANPCSRYDASEMPEQLKSRKLVVRAYSARHWIYDAKVVDEGEVEEAARQFLEDPEVAYVHLRNPAYGCFLCSLERG